jgi:rhodanese-related sulfurtransferase
MAAKTLTDMGYDAKPIEGGLKAWRECGLPVDE